MNTPSSDLETLLRSLSPEPLSTNRDELFFRAGYAAGAKTRGARLFWPSAAAALLVVSIGLGIAMQRQTVALHTALAAQNPLPVGEGRVRAPENLADGNQPNRNSEAIRATSTQLTAQHPHPNPLPMGEGEFYNDRLRGWQQLANANFYQHGRLTARGLIESPDDVPQPAQDSPAVPTSRPRTYLELRQLHLEG
jgi:hypothetical protein